MSILYPSNTNSVVTLSSNAVTASITGTPSVSLSNNSVTASISGEPTVKTKSTTVSSYSRTTIGASDVNYARPIHGTFQISSYDENRKKLTIYNRSSDDLFLSIVDSTYTNLSAFNIPGPYYDFENLPFTASTAFTSMFSASEGIYFGDYYFGGPGSQTVQYNGNSYGKLVLWNGSSLSVVGGGLTGSGGQHGVRAILSSSNGLYVAGTNLVSASGTPINNIAVWNGSSWSNLSGASGVLAGVNTLYSSSAGLYAGFGTGTSFNYIAIWNGSDWATLSGGLNGSVYGIDSGSQGLYVAGMFTNTNNNDVTLNYAALWNGATWSGLGNGLKATTFGFATGFSGSIAVLSASEGVYYGGAFAGNFDSTTSASAFLKWDGSVWSDLGTCFGGGNSAYAQIWRIKSGSYGIIVSGDFDYQKDSDSSGTRLGSIGKWNGTSWSSITVEGNY